MLTDTVGVAPGDTVILAKHYGSLYTMADYRSEVVLTYLSATYTPTAPLTISGTISYTRSRSGLDKVIMPAVSKEVETALPHQDFTFTDMDEYSDILYGMVQASLGVAYRVSPKVSLTADADYSDLNDNAGYVYGIESGSYFFIRTGVKIDL